MYHSALGLWGISDKRLDRKRPFLTRFCTSRPFTRSLSVTNKHKGQVVAICVLVPLLLPAHFLCLAGNWVVRTNNHTLY